MLNKVKEHVRKHKGVYLIGSYVVVAGITYYIMRGTRVQGALGINGVQGAPSNTASLIFRNKQTINVLTVLEREGRGHPGWPVRNLETKHIFLSQKAAADAFDISKQMMSGHLNGKFPDIDGLHFERVNLASS